MDAGSPARSENLALLYQGILTAIVRIQSGRQPLVDPNAFQKRMEGAIAEIEREAIRIGYGDQDVQEANYAVIAFLDETIQRSNDPSRGQWSPLQGRMYSQVVAGEGVFDRLKAIQTRRDSADLADVLEVYYLCLLLGYEGRYALDDRPALQALMRDLRDRIERIRGPRLRLAPDGPLPEAPVRVETAAPPDHSVWRALAVAGVCLAVLSWVVLKVVLGSYAQGVAREMMGF